jgi:Protein of unknown function (DUF3891)
VLVRTTDEGALAIGQLSHAWLSGQLARAWGNELLRPADPFEEVVLGAEQHDVGWALFDLEPTFNRQSGLPRGFLELTVDEHLAIWRDAPERLLSQSQHAALVVSMHGSSLSELRVRAAPEQADALRAHIDQEHARQESLRRALGISERQAELTRRQMWAWDGLSLALCMAWRPFTARELPTRTGMIEIELRDLEHGVSTLDPWPFSVDELEVRCEARQLAARYETEAQMRDAFEHTAPAPLTFTLRKA